MMDNSLNLKNVNLSTAKIGDHFKVVCGGTPARDNPDFWNGNIPWITPKDMTNDGGSIATGEEFLSNLGAAKMSKRLLPKGSLIVSTRATIGRCSIADNDIYTNQGCHGLIPIGSVSSDYMKHWITINQAMLRDLSSGTTFLELSTSKIRDINFAFPSSFEQKAITDCLDLHQACIRKIESAIEKQEAAFKQLRRGLVRGKLQIREQNGRLSVEALSQSNLPEDCDDTSYSIESEGWQRTTLFEAATIINGQSPSETNADEGIEFHQGCTSFTQYDGLKKSGVYTKKSRKLAPANSILFSVRAPVGSIVLTDREVSIGRGLASIIPHSIDASFLLHLLHVSKVDFADLSNGSTFDAINSRDLKNYSFNMPELQQQKVISKFLDDFDKSIKSLVELKKLEQKKFNWLRRKLMSGTIKIEQLPSQDE